MRAVRTPPVDEVEHTWGSQARHSAISVDSDVVPTLIVVLLSGLPVTLMGVRHDSGSTERWRCWLRWSSLACGAGQRSAAKRARRCEHPPLCLPTRKCAVLGTSRVERTTLRALGESTDASPLRSCQSDHRVCRGASLWNTDGESEYRWI